MPCIIGWPPKPVPGLPPQPPWFRAGPVAELPKTLGLGDWFPGVLLAEPVNYFLRD